MVSVQPVLSHRDILLWIQDLALAFELHAVSVCAFLEPVQVPLWRSPVIQGIDYFVQFGVIVKLAEDPFCPITQVVNKDIR